MTGYEAAFISIIIATAFFAGVAYLKMNSIRGVFDFFHNPSPKKNAFSLTIANITLGSGVVYLVLGAETNGILMLLAPAAILAGYLFLSKSSKSLESCDLEPGEDLLHAAQRHLDRLNPNDPVPLAKYFSIFLMVVYALGLSYELLASPMVMMPFLTTSPGTFAAISISFFLLLTALLTVVFGGVSGVLRTDIVQMISAIILILIVLAAICPQGGYQETASIDSILIFTTSSFVAVLMVCVAAISTQYYSLINLAVGSHLESNKRARTFRVVGVSVAIITGFFIFASLITQAHGENLLEMTANMFSPIGQSKGFFPVILGFSIAFGLSSIICSTADSTIIAITQFWYFNVSRGDSGREPDQQRSLKNIRLWMAASSIVGFGLLSILYSFRQDLFTLLLFIASGVPAFAPAIWLLFKLVSKPHTICVFTRTVLWTYLSLIVLAYFVAVALLLTDNSKSIGLVGIVALAISIVITFFVWKKARKIDLNSNISNNSGAVQC
ncbi:MAG: hypothetical protein P9M14_07565 [Candidatus Alcyoniella australis]|nr:hypothetical protein [Candidatus Alcyoniella australis]